MGTLILTRAVMGFAAGAYTPTSIAATLEASKPTWHGRNIGIQQMALPLFGLGLAPILVTQLPTFLPWHSLFAIVSIPRLPDSNAAFHLCHDCADVWDVLARNQCLQS
ncbi:hypothetical protein PQR37_37515 [Paraburkholderia nemoris]|uniref:hypothetical protein n=1 Tax=Paraburkholderia nemoris TaxID=2793076 RepID=UPI0038B7374E